jgi:transposase
MGKHFMPYEPDQALLLPPSLNDWLPDGHLGRFVSETVDELDLSPFLAKYKQREDGRGRVAYQPRMMLKLLIYSYCSGIFSSRKVATGLVDLVPLRYLAAGNVPSHRTIARFRQEYHQQFQGLFVQVVRIAMEAGLVKMGTLAIDGTKLKANASKHKSMSYERMQAEEKKLEAEISRIIDLARGIDEAEDEEFGPDFRGDELPKELQRRESRVKKIREAKARLEEEQAQKDKASDHGKKGRKVKRPAGTPEGKAQANFSDPESRIMGNPKKGFVQGYNGQIAVDGEANLIVAGTITQSAADGGQLVPVLKEAVANTGQKPKSLLADAGYKSEEDLLALEKMKVDAHVALGRGESLGGLSPKAGPATKRMHRKRQTKRSQKAYKRRKVIAEPPFGWIKSVMGFREFSMRGLSKVSGEWSLVCMALNIRRMSTRLTWI